MPAHDLGVVGWFCLTAIWLGSVALVCQTVLTCVRWVLRHLDRRRGLAPRSHAEDAVSSAIRIVKDAQRHADRDRRRAGLDRAAW